MTVLLSTIFVFIVASTSATIFPPKYGSPRPVYHRHAAVPRGLQVGPRSIGPISHILPLIPAFHRKVNWVKKVGPRTGNWVNVIRRKSFPLSPTARNHFARKAHIAKKIHYKAKARSIARMNRIRSRVLGVARQQRYPTKRVVQHKSRQVNNKYDRLPGKIARFNRRHKLEDALRPQLRTRPPFPNRMSFDRRSVQLDREFYDKIDNSFDDRFDNGFSSTFKAIRPDIVSNQMNARATLMPNNIQEVEPRGFTNSAKRFHSTQGHYPKQFATSAESDMRIGSASGFQRTVNSGTGRMHIRASQYPNEMLKQGANRVIFNSFDGKVSNDINSGSNVGILSSQQTPPNVDHSRFMFVPTIPSVPNIPTFTNVNDDFPSVVVRDNHELDGFIDIDDDDDDDDDDNDDDDNDKFDVLHDRIEEELDSVDDHLAFINRRLDLNLNDMLNSITDLEDKVSEQINDIFGSHISDDLLTRDDIAGELEDDISDNYPLRGVGGDLTAETDDAMGTIDESPIQGLQLLGPSTWQDVLTEIQSVGPKDDIIQMSPEDLQVFPVNPFSSKEIIPPQQDNTMIMDTSAVPTVPGTLALLGIDPSTIQAFESVVGETHVVPEHPPPIPLPNKDVLPKKQSSLDTQTASKIAIKVDNTNGGTTTGLTNLDQDIQTQLGSALDTLNRISVIQEFTDMDIVP